jgi:hypothetical protein
LAAAAEPPGAGTAARRLRADPTGLVLLAVACVAALLLVARPEPLVQGVRTGTAFLPLAGSSAVTSPLALVLVAALLGFVVTELRVREPLLDLRALPALARDVDLLGAALVAIALGGVVLAFATADPSVQAVSDDAPLLLAVSAAAAVALVLRQRRRADPVLPLRQLRDRAAWGALLVSTLLGAALVAVLVQVPVYARTVLTGETQVDAAAELLRFLVGLPVGALVGGWAVHRFPPAAVAGTGMAVATAGLAHTTTWQAATITTLADDAVLLATGLGIGAALPAVNASLLGAVPADVHGRGSALLVVARMAGKLVGLSLLTAVGLRTFTRLQAQLPSPAELCPQTPLRCPAYTAGVQATVLGQVQSTLTAAAWCAAAASVLALVLLARRALRDTGTSLTALQSGTA